MKKYLALLLALVLAFGVVLTACGGDKAPETTAPKADAGNDATDAPEATDAPADEPKELTTIKVWGQDPYVGQKHLAWDLFMNEDHIAWNYFVDKMEDLGIVFEAEAITAESYGQTTTQRLNAVMDLPDIIDFQNGWSQSQMIAYGQAGNLLNLTDAIAKYDEDGSIMEFLNLYSTFPSILDENGDLWFMPYANGSGYAWDDNGVRLGSTYTLSLRKDWMDALGIEYKYIMTPDEIFDILKAFRDNDANGNGVADEVIWANPGDPWFASGFGFAGNDMFYCFSDGTFGAGIDHPNFPEYIKYYQKLYNEGIISADQFNEGYAPTPANQASGVFSYAAQTWEEASIVGYEDTAVYAPILIDDDGGENGFILPWADSPEGMLCGWGVRADADEATIEAIINLFDWMCSDEFVLFSRWGVEGEGWDYDENGEPYDLWEGQERPNEHTTLGAKVIFNWIPNFNRPGEGKADLEEQYAERDKSDKYFVKHDFEFNILNQQADNPDKCVYRSGSGFYAMATAAEQEAYDAVSADVNTYYNELMTALMTGEKSIDDLATYRAELSELGFDTMKDIMQARCERFWAGQE